MKKFKKTYKRTEAQIAKAAAKRAALIDASNTVKLAMQLGQLEAETINAGLIEMYSEGKDIEFKKFADWKKLGYSVKKGSTSFPVWSAPIKAKKSASASATASEGETSESKEYKLFAICNLFSSEQVEKK